MKNPFTQIFEFNSLSEANKSFDPSMFAILIHNAKELEVLDCIESMIRSSYHSLSRFECQKFQIDYFEVYRIFTVKKRQLEFLIELNSYNRQIIND